MKFRILALLTIAIGSISLTSCLPLMAGAAVGYVAHDNGYRVQNPITKH